MEQRNKRVSPAVKIRRAVLGTLLAAACVASPLKLGVISGDSMAPTFHDRQFYVMDRSHYRLHPLRRGDVVIFDQGKTPCVKRVLAVGGDMVYLWRHPGDGEDELVMDWQLERVKRLVKQKPWSNSFKLVQRRLPEGYAFMVGDNIHESRDSRSFGPVAVEQIRGKVLQAPPARRELDHIAGDFPSSSAS